MIHLLRMTPMLILNALLNAHHPRVEETTDVERCKGGREDTSGDPPPAYSQGPKTLIITHFLSRLYRNGMAR